MDTYAGFQGRSRRGTQDLTFSEKFESGLRMQDSGVFDAGKQGNTPTWEVWATSGVGKGREGPASPTQ